MYLGQAVNWFLTAPLYRYPSFQSSLYRNMSSTKLTSYNVLSVDNYTDKTLQDPYWATGDWSQCTPPQQYIHSHRYIGESILVLLENSGIIGHSGNNVSSDPIKVFNAGCGPAQVESYIHENKGDRQVEILSGDRDEVMLEEARRKYHLGKWVGNEIKIMDILVSVQTLVQEDAELTCSVEFWHSRQYLYARRTQFRRRVLQRHRRRSQGIQPPAYPRWTRRVGYSAKPLLRPAHTCVPQNSQRWTTIPAGPSAHRIESYPYSNDSSPRRGV